MLQFGNQEQINQGKENVRQQNIDIAISKLFLSLCEAENLSKNKNALSDYLETHFKAETMLEADD
jgi:hypothetical protein